MSVNGLWKWSRRGIGRTSFHSSYTLGSFALTDIRPPFYNSYTRSFAHLNGTCNLSEPTADIGLIGLAVMGENLVLNMESRGYTVAVFNRTTAKVDEFLAGRGKGKKFVGAHTPQELVAAIKKRMKSAASPNG